MPWEIRDTQLDVVITIVVIAVIVNALAPNIVTHVLLFHIVSGVR